MMHIHCRSAPIAQLRDDASGGCADAAPPLTLSSGGVPLLEMPQLKTPNQTLWAGVCAGGYFAAAAVYLGNIVVLAALNGGNIAVTLAMVGFPVACGVMGGLVAAQKAWVPKWSLVVAAGFAAIHLIGLVYLFFDAPGATPSPTSLLQWRLGSSFFALWLVVAFAANKFARTASSPASGP
jgi:hypothetical protein